MMPLGAHTYFGKQKRTRISPLVLVPCTYDKIGHAEFVFLSSSAPDLLYFEISNIIIYLSHLTWRIGYGLFGLV